MRLFFIHSDFTSLSPNGKMNRQWPCGIHATMAIDRHRGCIPPDDSIVEKPRNDFSIASNFSAQ